MALPITTQINYMVEAERDAWITDHGDTAEIIRAELAILDQIKKTCETKIRAMRDLAVEDGMAEWKLVTIKEHIRKEHIQQRFTWIV